MFNPLPPYAPMTLAPMFSDYTFHDSPAVDDIVALHRLLIATYWAADRSLEEVRNSVEASVVLVARDKESGLIGFARAVTDRVTFSWICDVVVDPAHRGRGVGTELMRRLLEHPDVAPTRKVLVTKDAQRLYRRMGFDTHPCECMIRHPQSDSG